MSAKTLKILFVNTLDDPRDGAGAERTILQQIQAIKVQGHNAVFAATSPVSGLHLHIRDGLRVWRAGLKNLYWPERRGGKTPHWIMRRAWHVIDAYNWQMRRQLEAVMAIERPDIISAHGLSGWSVSVIDAAFSASIPVVQVLHDYYNACPNQTLFKSSNDCMQQCISCKIARLGNKARTNKVSAVIGVSQHILKRHLELGYYRNVPLQRVIHNQRAREGLRIIDADRLNEERFRGAPENHVLTFGFIGTLAPPKGLELLFESFAKLPEGQARLLVAGSGKAEYVATLKQKYSARNIEFLGQVEPHEFFGRIDVNIVPSLWQENLPGVVIEGFAFGVPSIGSLRGGIPELIEDGRSGILFEPETPGGLLQAMMLFLDHPWRLAVLKQNVRARSEAFLNPEIWAQQYIKVYKAILKIQPVAEDMPNLPRLSCIQ